MWDLFQHPRTLLNSWHVERISPFLYRLDIGPCLWMRQACLLHVVSGVCLSSASRWWCRGVLRLYEEIPDIRIQVWICPFTSCHFIFLSQHSTETKYGHFVKQLRSVIFIQHLFTLSADISTDAVNPTLGQKNSGYSMHGVLRFFSFYF